MRHVTGVMSWSMRVMKTPLVANIMNEHFVSIKVDREERPDIDQLYMDAAYLISGNGGWPLNVLALPDGRPFYAGTYFTRKLDKSS